MSMRYTRREVLALTGAGLAAVRPAEDRAPVAQAPPAGEIEVRRTHGGKRYAEEPPVRWQAGAAAAGAVRLDPARTYQEVLGFGASFTDAACSMIDRLSPDARGRLLRELLDPSEMNFSVARICIGSSDYATKAYSYDDGDADPGLSRFSVDHDREYILPILLEARKTNPDLFLLASPWSPPGWMKANNSMLGGSMRSTSFPAYAQYFVKFLQAYEAAGVAVDAVTPQNEVDTDQDGRMPACLWGQEYEIEFVAEHLGPQLARNGLAAKIWILDHNYDLWGRAICTLDKPGVNRYVDGVAWHGYVGGPEMMTRVHLAHPGKHMYWTEGGPDYKDPAYLTDWARWSAAFSGILRNWARCVIGWNVALDEQGRPNIGPFSCGGIVTIDSRTLEIARSGMYWALAHYSRAIARGARRIESEGGSEALSHVAFANPDGGFVLVLTNRGPDGTAPLLMGGMSAEVPVPSGSITTLTWRS